MHDPSEPRNQSDELPQHYRRPRTTIEPLSLSTGLGPMRGYPMRILGTLALVSAKERLLGLKTKRTACNKQGRGRAGLDALPIFIS